MRGAGAARGFAAGQAERKRVKRGHWDVRENREEFVRSLEDRLGIGSAEQWKSVTAATVAEHGGSSLLARYGNSMSRMLAECGASSLAQGGRGKEGDRARESEGEIAMRTRKYAPRRFWESRENCKSFLEKFAKEQGIRSPSGWKAVTKRQLSLAGGSGLLREFSGSLSDALRETIYRNLPPELFEGEGRQRPRGYWADASNRRAFLRSFCLSERVELPSDWMAVSANQLAAAGGSGLLARYGGSLAKAVWEVCKGEELGMITDSGEVEGSFWREKRNARRFLEKLARVLRIKSFLEMGRITVGQIREAGGEGLLERHGGSVRAVICFAFDGRKTAAEFAAAGETYWEDGGHIRLFMDEVASRYGWESLPLQRRWSALTKKDVSECGGGLLLKSCGGSLEELLKRAYPEEQWNVRSTRECVGDGYWTVEENVCSFIRSLESSFSLSSPEEWYRVSHAQLREMGAAGLLQQQTLFQVLSMAYPAIKWDQSRLATSGMKKAAQRHLATSLKGVFAA